jgi:DNA invertase Pin-like site-specific DNA recombinase
MSKPKADKTTAIYARVSTGRQDLRGQEGDLAVYKAAVEARGEKVVTYTDKATGADFERPGWAKLWQAVLDGRIGKVVVWRLDRLGRTAGPLIALLDELAARGVGFASIRDGFDPSTPAGRLTRNVLASVAQFETEVRRERQLAGIEAVREANGGRCPWGGREKGSHNVVTRDKIEAVRKLHADGHPIAAIARVTHLSRPTIYKFIREGQRRR